jgi:predicted nucleic acid-binding protein
MIVVSNTSPLTNLAAIRQFDLLWRLYEQINIPEGVWSELNAYGKR